MGQGSRQSHSSLPASTLPDTGASRVRTRRLRVVGHDIEFTGASNDTYLINLPEEVWDPTILLAKLLLNADGVALDVGANIGVTAAALSLTVPKRQVIALEPSPLAYGHLLENLKRNGLHNVCPLNLAASSERTSLSFSEIDGFGAGSLINAGTLQSGAHRPTTTVEAIMIDDLVVEMAVERLDLLKIDVEGHEMSVLRGARKTIERFRPTAIVEFNIFALTSFGGVLPGDFLQYVMTTFPVVYDYRLGQEPVLLDSIDAVHQVIHDHFVHGPVSDLACRFEPLPAFHEVDVTASVGRRADRSHARPTRVVSVEPPISTESHSNELPVVTADQLRQLLAAWDELEAVRATVSWRITSPLRRARRLMPPKRRSP